jgi:hypothetical protein
MDQPEVAYVSRINVVPFRPRPVEPGASLSLRDRMAVTLWREAATAAGYDRLVIHERSALDPPEVECFLGVYRRGEAWARWGIARCGAQLTAWCSATGRDIGRFASMEDALRAVLAGREAAGGRVIKAFA